jgi:hypothetical protein
MSIDSREYFKDLHDASAEEVQWIIKGVTPVGLQVVGGEPKSFKSTFTDALPAICAGWSNNQLPKWAKLATDMDGPSMLLSGEATVNELVWLYRKGFGCETTPGTIFVNDDPLDFKLDRKETLNALLDMLNEVQPRLCIIDPLRKYHNGDENDAAFMEEILYPLRKWAIRNNSAIIVVHHARKASAQQDNESLMDASNLRGSNAIFGAADSVLMCRCVDRTIGKLRVSAIHKRAAGWTRDLLLGVPGNEKWSKIGSEVITPVDYNVKLLFAAGADVQQIAKQLKLKEAEVNEAIDKLERNK